MAMSIIKEFRAHPATVGESYTQHGVRALAIAFRLIKIGLAAFVHALVPGLFKTTASDEILVLNEEIVALRQKAAQQ
jgi:hypothetical protein